MDRKNGQGYSELAVGVDIGGTKISAGLVKDEKILIRETIQTPNNDNRKEIIEAIFSVIKKVAGKGMAGIGIGVPGLVDTNAGIAYDIQNIPALTGVPLKKRLGEHWKTNVSVNNDANCFALGAKNCGIGKNFQNLVALSLGTGLGSGVVINGQLYEGVGCGAGEFGLLPYKNGILEHYCSGQFFQRQYNISGEKAAILAKQGDKDALQMFHRFGCHLGEAIKIVAYTFAPEAIMLGGSISKSFTFFQQSMWDEIHDFPYHHVVGGLKVLPVINPDIAIIGAASLVKNQSYCSPKKQLGIQLNQ